MYDYRADIEKLKWTHFVARPMMTRALKTSSLTDTGRQLMPGAQNMLDVWESNLADRFFDMGTMIRLGSTIETCLKHYYMDKKNHSNLVSLKNDPAYKKNIFQRVQTWNGADSAQGIYQNELGIDLTKNSDLVYLQEAMLHRHLYAHNSGLLDDEYMQRIKQITGEDLMAIPEVTRTYPLQDTYWFEPLNRITNLIERTQSFFQAL